MLQPSPTRTLIKRADLAIQQPPPSTLSLRLKKMRQKKPTASMQSTSDRVIAHKGQIKIKDTGHSSSSKDDRKIAAINSVKTAAINTTRSRPLSTLQ